jgi:hypothetical protein
MIDLAKHIQHTLLPQHQLIFLSIGIPGYSPVLKQGIELLVSSKQ